MDDNCYVLLIDILGFTKLVETKSSHEILNIIKKFLSYFEAIDGKDNLSTLNFSDSAILWQKNPTKKDFLRFSTISVLMCSNLLANKIPCRGAIAYGPFTVNPDDNDKHNVFFGKALIEAYKAQASENWIGITVCPSAVNHIDPDIIDKCSGGHFLKRSDGTLLLNPFLSIQRFYKEFDKPGLGWVKGSPYELYLLLELLAFKFINDEASKFTDNCDFSSREACKYHNAIAFLQKVLPGDCFKKAKEKSNYVEMKYGEPRIINTKSGSRLYHLIL